jgi:hypothetical protein
MPSILNEINLSLKLSFIINLSTLISINTQQMLTTLFKAQKGAAASRSLLATNQRSFATYVHFSPSNPPSASSVLISELPTPASP